MEWNTRWGFLENVAQQYERKRKRFQSPYDDKLALISQALLNEEFLSARNRRYIREEIARHRGYFRLPRKVSTDTDAV